MPPLSAVAVALKASPSSTLSKPVSLTDRVRPSGDNWWRLVPIVMAAGPSKRRPKVSVPGHGVGRVRVIA